MASNETGTSSFGYPQDHAIPSGKLKCYISGKLRKDTPEERIRQDVARSLVEEYGYLKKDISIELGIKMGTAKKRVDIAIFYENSRHKQENIYIIVETKREDVNPSDRKEGIEQLKSYVAACPNATYALWFGSERLSYKVDVISGRRSTAQIPDIPKNGETSVPKPTIGTLVPAVNLKQVFKRIHNYIYANQGFQKDKAFEELQKLIFIKVFDEQFSRSLQFYILPNEAVENVRLRLQDVFRRVQERYKYIFKGNEVIELNDIVLGYVVSELQRFSLVDTQTDVKGEAYEEIVGPNLRGDRGEFFTPRNVCALTMDLLFSLLSEDKIASPGEVKILDPAVGTGGFLIAGIQKMRQLFSNRGFKYDQLRDLVREVADTNFFGIDFNPFLVKVAQMNMVMHGDGSSNILQANSLETPTKWKDEGVGKIHLGDFDVVVTNPPFGTKAVIDSPDVLEQFELASGKGNQQRTSLPPEQLFIERCLSFLKPGGILGIVLPDSVLSNPGLTWIREWILRKAYIIASIDLPVETFQPHTGTQTSVLLLRKKTPEQERLEENYAIFMAIVEKVGHDRRGNPTYIVTPDGEVEVDATGMPRIEDDLPIVAQQFDKWVKDKGMV